MTDPMQILDELEAHAQELDQLSTALAGVERQLVAVETDYEEFMGAFEAGLWERHTADGEKFPPEKLRERMGRRQMDPDLLGRYTALMGSRKRMQGRLGSLKATVEAKRSILSALKVEAEASGGGLRRAA